MVDDDRRGCCRCSTGAATSVRRGGSALSVADSRHAEGWYWGKVLTLLIGARADSAEGSTATAEASCRVLELHSSESHVLDVDCAEATVELDVWEAASEKTEEVEEEADEERDEAYG